MTARAFGFPVQVTFDTDIDPGTDSPCVYVQFHAGHDSTPWAAEDLVKAHLPKLFGENAIFANRPCHEEPVPPDWDPVELDGVEGAVFWKRPKTAPSQ